MIAKLSVFLEIKHPLSIFSIFRTKDAKRLSRPQANTACTMYVLSVFFMKKP